MPVWSSPFPCRVPEGWDAPASFPSPEGTTLLFDSPDRVLLSWGRQNQCDGSELERFEQGCRSLLDLRDRGGHQIRPCWLDSAAPSADGISACLLLQVLQACPDSLKHYFALDPSYLQRLLQAQSQPRQLLNRWLQSVKNLSIKTDQPLQRQLQAALDELDQRQMEQQRVETLLDQHQDQQRRTRRLLVRWMRPQAS